MPFAWLFPVFSMGTYSLVQILNFLLKIKDWDETMQASTGNVLPH